MSNSRFNEYKLSGDLLKAIKLLNFTTPTSVQERVIPSVLDGNDIIVKSQTGSGKTAAFAIPIAELIDWNENKAQAIVLTPTRELANQVREDIFNIGRFKRLKVVAVYGKSPIRSQIKDLKQKTHVVVGTPGRIIDHIERGTLDLSNIKNFVIDEADEMLNMGFIEQIESIIKKLPRDRVTTLLSATMPSDIENLCSKYMNKPVFVEIENKDLTSDRITQERYDVKHGDKIGLLFDLITIENPDSCIIFCNTRQAADDVYRELDLDRLHCEKIHGGMEQDDRTEVMNNFKKGHYRYLVATDVAARGIDIDNISLVINYDIPRESESYVHRIGRTGRKSNLGRAITFVTPNEKRFLNDIHTSIGTEIPLKERPDGEMVDKHLDEFDVKNEFAPEIKEEKGAELDKEILKIHINAGKKTKMRPTDIVGTLCGIDGMSASDIGIISVLDISTFVEILNNKGEMVFNKLQNTPIKGRLRTVSKANS
jgi:superfamily II DNA/RNA helicase